MITRRRAIIVLGASALAAPLRSFAQQQPAKIPRIGFLGLTSVSSPDLVIRLEALRAGLRELGYVEGKNIVIEFRWAESKYERLPELAAELVRLPVDILVTQGTPGTRAAKQATTTIPIVMVGVSDPVATGLVASIARPGGNISGAAFFTQELNAKRLELLRDAFPRARAVGVLFNSNNASMPPILQAMEAAARQLKLDLHKFAVRGPEDFEGAFAAMAKTRIDAVASIDDGMLNANVKAIADIAARRRLPSIGIIELAEAGGLMAYGVIFSDVWRRAAGYVDKILKGARPGDLPVDRAVRYELIVNLKTAKALGLTIPTIVVQRADRVIE